MHRTIGDGYIVEDGKNIYADEDPGVRDATQVRHEEMNAIQEEICNVITDEGFSLNAPTESLNQMNQLNTAIDQKLGLAILSEANARATGDANEAAARISADDGLQIQIDNLTSTDISNTSGVPGTKITDALEDLQSQITGIGALVSPKYFIEGCGWSRADDTFMYKLLFKQGVAIDSTGTVLLTMPGSGAFEKRMQRLISIPYSKGHQGNGFPESIANGISVGANVYIFLCKLGDDSFDIGFDTSIDAVNLIADPIAAVQYYRRIGWTQIQWTSASWSNPYKCMQEGNYHKTLWHATYNPPTYSVPVGISGGTLTGNNIYIPQTFNTIVHYLVSPPGGGACRSVCAPISYGIDFWKNNNLWMAANDSSMTVYGHYGSSFVECQHNFSSHGFLCFCDPYSARTCNFGILGFIDFRGQDGGK